MSSPIDSSDVFLGRQPILDRNQQLLAYELLFRSSSGVNAANVAISDGVQATATVIANAFSELSVGDALGPYKGFINVDEDFLLSDTIELLPKDNVVLEILETVEITPAIIERCQALRAMGFTLALDDVIEINDEISALLDLVEIVKIDLPPLTDEEIEALVKELKHHRGIKLLAEKIDNREQMERCLDLGFDLFQGYYFAKPTIIAGKKLNPSELTVMKLLGLLLEDAETHDLEKAFKHEPGLTINLLRLTNSVAMGLSTRVTSLSHAIAVLGRRQLQRWLQLLMFSTKGGSHAVSPLLQLAATRGRLMELFADKLRPHNKEFADHAFMTGIMSLMPALLGLPIIEVVASLGLANEIKLALTENYAGHLGQMLKLVEDLERNDVEASRQDIAQLPALNPQTVNACLSQALAWANNIGREA
jgi:EAL and modified HD-GYP domain-containing signal transduction protein